MLWYPSCAGWHGASSSSWLYDTYCGFRRGENGVFSCNGVIEWADVRNCGRGVAVVGTGL